MPPNRNSSKRKLETQALGNKGCQVHGPITFDGCVLDLSNNPYIDLNSSNAGMNENETSTNGHSMVTRKKLQINL